MLLRVQSAKSMKLISHCHLLPTLVYLNLPYVAFNEAERLLLS
jgi:hypothetical protein